jgi:adenosine deaminase CECR1
MGVKVPLLEPKSVVLVNLKAIFSKLWHAQIIYSTIRFITPEELEWYLEDCIALKKEFPHLIAGSYLLVAFFSIADFLAGFDLVGDENALKPLIYYIEPLLRFCERQKEEGVDIPFLFHAGETLGDGTDADVNLYDAILLGTKRIGHGYVLLR